MEYERRLSLKTLNDLLRSLYFSNWKVTHLDKISKCFYLSKDYISNVSLLGLLETITSFSRRINFFYGWDNPKSVSPLCMHSLAFHTAFTSYLWARGKHWHFHTCSTHLVWKRAACKSLQGQNQCCRIMHAPLMFLSWHFKIKSFYHQIIQLIFLAVLISYWEDTCSTPLFWEGGDAILNM